MLANRLYYNLKPYLPWRLRMALRRALARRKKVENQDVWPINEAAAQPPAGWPGWPDGKKFAFVLTHDVEGPAGLAKCHQLMKLEKELGFHSSFNFIPEGSYAVSRELREELAQNGFEVGVHDLHHDGMLYSSRRNFSESAQWINRYLKEWGAAGFRSGFMLRNLDWLHELNIQYDASTFDTDPFEPQPDGTGTIFPFWVSAPPTNKSEAGSQTAEPSSDLGLPVLDFGTRTSDFVSFNSPIAPHASRAGYVELPYTLAQDSTLFQLLLEPTPEIWLRKLDWIVQHGGMALVNVHPDYLRFPGETASARTFPVEHYVQLLQRVRSRYASIYWQPLPRDLARWYAATCRPVAIYPTTPDAAAYSTALRGKSAAVVLFSECPADPRPWRAAAALARQGTSVDMICLKGSLEKRTRETLDGVNIFRVPLKRRRGGKLNYIFQYGSFLLTSFIVLSWRSLFRRYDLVHVHNMPDVLVFSALVPKALGAKVVLDLHDPMPELMLTIFNLPPDSRLVRFLKRLEKWSTSFADLVLTVNQASKRIYTSRSCAPEKIGIVMNSPDEQIFQFQPPVPRRPERRPPNGSFVMMYHGSVLHRNGLDVAVDALEKARRSIPNASLLVCGEYTAFFEEVMHSVKSRGLQDAVRYLGRKNCREIVEAIDQCDIGIIPNRRSTFTEMNTPTRIFEYLARGKPVIAPRAQGIQDYFDAKDIIYFELGDAGDLARKIEYAFSHPDEVEEFVRRGQKIYSAHRWSQENLGFLEAVTGLLANARRRHEPAGPPIACRVELKRE